LNGVFYSPIWTQALEKEHRHLLLSNTRFPNTPLIKESYKLASGSRLSYFTSTTVSDLIGVSIDDQDEDGCSLGHYLEPSVLMDFVTLKPNLDVKDKAGRNAIECLIYHNRLTAVCELWTDRLADGPFLHYLSAPVIVCTSVDKFGPVQALNRLLTYNVPEPLRIELINDAVQLCIRLRPDHVLALTDVKFWDLRYQVVQALIAPFDPTKWKHQFCPFAWTLYDRLDLPNFHAMVSGLSANLLFGALKKLSKRISPEEFEAFIHTKDRNGRNALEYLLRDVVRSSASWAPILQELIKYGLRPPPLTTLPMDIYAPSIVVVIGPFSC